MNYSKSMEMKRVWETLAVVGWSQLLLDSYRHWLGRELIERQGGAEEQAAKLFHAPFVVVSHGTQADPILNYGNQTALALWEMDWAQLTQNPLSPDGRASQPG